MRAGAERAYTARNEPSLCEGKVLVETFRLNLNRRIVRWHVFCNCDLLKRPKNGPNQACLPIDGIILVTQNRWYWPL